MAESGCSASESEDDWDEEEEASGCGLDSKPCLCLFCATEFSEGSQAVLEHCAKDHDFQLQQLISKLELDVYSCIKLINYIRKEHPEPSVVLTATPVYPWLPDVYLTPVIPDDPLLQVDFEFLREGDSAPISSESSSETSLKAKLNAANEMVSQFHEALSQAREDLENMKHAVQDLVGEELPGDRTPMDAVAEGKWGEEEGYFGSYTHFKIHEEMLKDEARTETYKLFIEKNAHLFAGKVVLDIGCGTGVLSLFAASAGAKLVIGIDQSNIIYKAMDIVRENGFEDRVTLIKGKVEELELPVPKVDIIISEWMGYFLLYESMLDTVLFARDKWLKDRCHVFPNSCSISIVALGNQFEWNSRVHYWDNVYGFKMSCMREDVLREPAIQVVDHRSTISSTDTIKKLDLCKVSKEDLDFEAPFSLVMQHSTKCHALVGYFDVGFTGVTCPFHLSTSPQDTPTHWKQSVFYLRKPISVNTGDLLKGWLSCKKSQSDPRSLVIVIRFELHSFSAQAQTVEVEQTFVLE